MMNQIFGVSVSIYRGGIDSRQFTIAAPSAMEAVKAALRELPENPDDAYEIRCFRHSEGVVIEDSDRPKVMTSTVAINVSSAMPYEPIEIPVPPPPQPKLAKRRPRRKARR